ncbi:hypothetical protein P1S61_37520 [Streptomyces sp. ME08-AFT2]|uniref:hypothetical protein n=1 Tax=Streptomyces sp. ME08-AFT2 TaxID=3028683 RepID=UPI0029B72931|nr:hypothetical protein [Streptomyces sp. ME08-AFT2]MDX3314657.1 hypothetical protein [Streptomyces sp. ME08-AFT2]
MPPPPPTAEQVRVFLADCRLRRHGWTRFQTGSRRTAERLAQKPAESDPCSYCYSTDGHHPQCPYF